MFYYIQVIPFAPKLDTVSDVDLPVLSTHQNALVVVLRGASAAQPAAVEWQVTVPAEPALPIVVLRAVATPAALFAAFNAV
jgi:hypothetical protein